jgi:hypothetical protein
MNIFDTQKLNSLLARIDKLKPDTQRQWGKMNAAQMLAHCNATLAAPAGEEIGKQMFLGKLLGWLAKPTMMGEKPIKPGVPTAKNFIFTNEQNFEYEKKRLEELLNKVHGREDQVHKAVHTFLGKLTAEEWGKSIYHHTDHHLKQFGL